MATAVFYFLVGDARGLVLFPLAGMCSKSAITDAAKEAR
jgi:hypothetical protein